MAISLISLIKPQNSGAFPTHEDVDCLGGFQVQSTITARNNIPTANRKEGMLVYVIASAAFFSLANDLTTWNAASLSGATGTAGGDLSGTYPNPQVVNIHGNGSVAFSFVPINFDVNLNGAGIGQTQTAANFGFNLNVTAQGSSAGGGTGGGLFLGSGTGSSAANAGPVYIQTGGTTKLQIGPSKMLLSIARRLFAQNFAGNQTINMTGAEDIMIIGSSVGPTTINLPNTSISNVGDQYTIKDGDGLASTNNIIINGVGAGSKIDGFPSYVMRGAYNSISIVNTGSGWGLI